MAIEPAAVYASAIRTPGLVGQCDAGSRRAGMEEMRGSAHCDRIAAEREFPSSTIPQACLRRNDGAAVGNSGATVVHEGVARRAVGNEVMTDVTADG